MTNPLFYSNRTDMMAALRLSKVCPNSDIDQILDQFLLSVRAKLWSCFGADRITTINATAFTEDPTTEAQYTRAIAADLEFKMVLQQAVLFLNTAFSDGGRAALGRFDAITPYLQAGVDARADLSDRIGVQVDELLGALGGCISAADIEPSVATGVTENPDRPTPGASVLRY